MASKINWKPILEMDMEDGTHTCYATTDRNGRFVWLTQMFNDHWDVEVAYKGEEIVTMASCKTLTSAKRWAARYLSIV